VDWFSWCTAGGFNGMVMSSEVGVAQAVITASQAWVLTDVIEAERLRREQIPSEFDLWSCAWQHPESADKFISGLTESEPVASDRPTGAERELPEELVAAKRRLLPEEVVRYRTLGQDAAAAATESLTGARPECTELEIAARASYELRKRGIDPALVQVGGEERVTKFRHVLPTPAKIGSKVMIAFCARRHGLYANLTRFARFGDATPTEQRLHETVAAIESEVLTATRPGAVLGHIYGDIAAAYRRHGVADEIDHHHQGGTTGYLSREVIARPGCNVKVEDSTAVAWNPSVPGAKIEDTFVCTTAGLELLTDDGAWPTREFEGRKRPSVLVLS
jgi:Xaa-Pro aminopeptidase